MICTQILNEKKYDNRGEQVSTSSQMLYFCSSPTIPLVIKCANLGKKLLKKSVTLTPFSAWVDSMLNLYYYVSP